MNAIGSREIGDMFNLFLSTTSKTIAKKGMGGLGPINYLFIRSSQLRIIIGHVIRLFYKNSIAASKDSERLEVTILF
jgi:hypothetical protein